MTLTLNVMGLLHASRTGVCLCSVLQAQWRTFTTSTTYFAGKRWRMSQGLGAYGNQYGPLVEIPDWSYADGRPAPIAPNERRRREKQKALAERAVALMQQMKEAKQNYHQQQDEKEQRHREFLSRRLKDKRKL